MNDPETRYEHLRIAYLDARDAFVAALVDRIGEVVHERFPDAAYLELESHRLEDGQLLLQPTAIRSDRVLAPRASADEWFLLNAAIEPLLQELGDVAGTPDEVAQGIAL